MDKYAHQKNGNLFYEEHGEGSPLLLIHGGLGAASHWANQMAVFSEKFRVLIPEQRGRGRTPDIAGPITFQNMTDDMIEFLENQVDGPAVLVGASDGGIIGLYLAIQRPDLISKLVLLGTNFDKDGVVLVFSEALKDWDPEDDRFKNARDLYGSLSPDGPNHWPIVFAKMKHLFLTEPNLTVADLVKISIPTLVMYL